MALDTEWKAVFPDRTRPVLYASTECGDDNFLPLTDVDDFLVDNISSLTPAQLYTLAANNAEALVQAQQEWTELERLATQIKNRDPLPPQIKDPQELPRRDVFEERKEATLYGYKYEPNRRMLPARFTVSENVTDQEKFDCREPPEPFAQGGFIPNDKQYKGIMTAARNEGREKNPDNQKPYTTNFALRDRPPGTWIAKMLQPEAPPPPRTRARQAALNGEVATSDRATRFNGEKVPPTRDVSLGPSDAPSPAKRTATPLSAADSPAMKKRRIDAVDITNGLPKKKHPNQYTKRREAEMAEQLAVAQDHARANGLPIPEHYTQLDTMSAPASPQPDKRRHPNQYTKRREREEAERMAREGSERDQAYGHYMPPIPPPAYGYTHQPPPFDRTYGYPPQHYGPAYPTYGAPPPEPMREQARPKHPNQYTKRREREEAERNALYGPPPYGHPYGDQQAHAPGAAPPYHPYGHHYGQPQALPPPPLEHKSSSSRGNTPAQNAGRRDISKMTPEEKRRHTFRDHELIAELNRDHSWINDDAELALAWKIKILSSDYPVRTWAMLRKWREWRAEGKDKRPRDKDGNRIRDAPAATQTTAPAVKATSGDVQMSNYKSGHAQPRSQSRAASASASDAVAHSAPASAPMTRTISPIRRPTRQALRTRVSGLDSPQAMPSSPLVNGINARELDEHPPASSLSFSSKLQGIGELDSAAKVDTWQEKTQTDYAASTLAGKGGLRQNPRLRQHGTEDDLYPSSNERDQASSKRDTSYIKRDEDDENESEDPLHGMSSPSTDPDPGEQEDTTYRGGSGTRTRGGRARPTVNGSTRMRRTRSALSNNSANAGAGLGSDPSQTTASPRPTRASRGIQNPPTSLPGASFTSTATNQRPRSQLQQTTRATSRSRTTSPNVNRRITRTSSTLPPTSTQSSTITVANDNDNVASLDSERDSDDDDDDADQPGMDDDEDEEEYHDDDDDDVFRSPTATGANSRAAKTGEVSISKRSLRPNPPKRTVTGDSLESFGGVGTRRSTRHG